MKRYSIIFLILLSTLTLACLVQASMRLIAVNDRQKRLHKQRQQENQQTLLQKKLRQQLIIAAHFALKYPLAWRLSQSPPTWHTIEHRLEQSMQKNSLHFSLIELQNQPPEQLTLKLTGSWPNVQHWLATPQLRNDGLSIMSLTVDRMQKMTKVCLLLERE